MAESVNITCSKQHMRPDSDSNTIDTLCSNSADSTLNNSQNMMDELKQQLIKANLKIEQMTKEIEMLKLENASLKGNFNCQQVVEPQRNVASENMSLCKILRSLRKKRNPQSDHCKTDGCNDEIGRASVALSLKVSTSDRVVPTHETQAQVPIQIKTPTYPLIADKLIKIQESSPKPDSIPIETATPIEVMIVEPKKESSNDVIEEDSIEANNDDVTTECDNAPSAEQLPCHICGATFDNVSQVANHLKIHTWTEPRVSDQLYTCGVCDETFATTELLEEHKNKHVGFPCHMCDARLKSMINLKKHIENHFKTPISCEHCDKVLPSVWSLQQHMKFHTNQTLPCPICQKHFATRSKLDQHLISHSTVKPYKCKFCIKEYSRESTLKIHMKLHTGQKNFVCDICSKGYCYSWKLKSHKRKHDKTKPKPFKCSDCDFAFHSNAQLKDHYAIRHSTETPYSCEACGVKFKTTKAWKYHTLRKHSKVKPYKCHMCEKSFVEKYLLDRHIKLHSDERPFPCQYCEKRFKSKSNLQVHNGYFHKDQSGTK